MDSALRDEFERIRVTRFWQLFEGELKKARDAAAKNLELGRIGEPTVRGEVWQERLRVIDQIMAAPSRLIDRTYNEE
jgi:hypothetical protein